LGILTMNLFSWLKRKPDATTDFTAVFDVALQKALAGVDDREAMRLIRGLNPQTASDVDASNYLRAYQTSLWVNACTVAIADACSAVPLKLRRRDTSEDIDKHDILNLLQRVNDTEDWPWFIGALVSYRQLAGEAFIILGPNAAKPAAMYLLRPDRMMPNVTGGRISEWVHTIGADKQHIPAEEVIQCKRWSPTNDLRGQPVLQAGEVSLNLDMAVRKFNNSYLRGGAIPPFMLTADGDLSKDQVALIEKAWDEKHSGVDKAGKPFIHGRGLKLEVLSDSKKEGSFVDLAKLSKGEIMALFKVPPIIVGDYSDASVLANAAVQEKQFWQRTILGGEMRQILGTLNEQLVSRWDRNLELYADEASMPELAEDEGERWARVSAAVGGPFLTVNEGRERLQMGPLGPEGDVVYVSPQLVPLGSEPEPLQALLSAPAEAQQIDNALKTVLGLYADEAADATMEAARQRWLQSGSEEDKQAFMRLLSDFAPTPKPPEPPPQKVASVLTLRHKSLVGEYGSDAHKAHFKAFTDRLEPQVVRMRRTVGDINEDLLNEVIANLEAEGGKGHRVTVPDLRIKAVADQYLFDLDAAKGIYRKELMPQMKYVMGDGAERAIAELGGGSFDLTDPRVIDWLAKKELKITTLPETLYDSIHLHLSQGVEQGRTIQQIAGDLRDLQPMYKRSFAERIARTEVVGANNAGSLEAYRQNDVKQKEWSTAGDEEVRVDHVAAHGQVVPVNKPFIIGGKEMDAPGDQSAGPAQVCNCFLDGQVPVFTDKGWKHIASIRPGDMVLTHKNRFRKVLRLSPQPTYQGDAVKLRIAVYNGKGVQGKTVLVTPEHPFATSAGWKLAKDFKPGDKVLVAALPCIECGEPAPLFRGSGYCSKRCHSLAITQRQWSDPEHRRNVSEKASAQLHREYASGIRDPQTIAVQARKVGFAKYGPGGYMAQMTTEERARGEEAICQKYGSKAEMIRQTLWPALGKRDKWTAIEKSMAGFLGRCGRQYVPQYAVGRRRVDFYVPAEKLFVECDGVQWHQDEEAERLRDIEILRQYPDHSIAHVTYGQGDKGQPVWKYRDLTTLNHEGQYTTLEADVVAVTIAPLKKGRKTFNFAVEEDESYVAKGYVCHNCRCAVLPVVE